MKFKLGIIWLRRTKGTISRGFRKLRSFTKITWLKIRSVKMSGTSRSRICERQSLTHWQLTRRPAPIQWPFCLKLRPCCLKPRDKEPALWNCWTRKSLNSFKSIRRLPCMKSSNQKCCTSCIANLRKPSKTPSTFRNRSQTFNLTKTEQHSFLS